MTLQAQKSFLSQTGQAVSLEQALYPMLVTTGKPRSIYICVEPSTLARAEFCRALGFTLTQYQRTQPPMVVTLALPDTPAFRAEAEPVTRNLAENLPWLRFMFVQSPAAPAPAPCQPKPVSDEELAKTWVAAAAREGLKGFESPQMARALVRVARELNKLKASRSQRTDADIVRVISKLATASTKADRRRLREQFRAAWPALAGEQLWAELVAVGSILRPARPAGNSEVFPSSTATNPEAKQRVHPSMRTRTLPAQPLENPQRTVEMARGNDYEGLDIPRPGSLYSLANRQPKRR